MWSNISVSEMLPFPPEQLTMATCFSAEGLLGKWEGRDTALVPILDASLCKTAHSEFSFFVASSLYVADNCVWKSMTQFQNIAVIVYTK